METHSVVDKVTEAVKSSLYPHIQSYMDEIISSWKTQIEAERHMLIADLQVRHPKQSALIL